MYEDLHKGVDLTVNFLLLLINIAFIVLKIMMLTHLVVESKLPSKSKKNWVIGFVLIGGIISIIYYFSVYRHEKKAQNRIWSDYQ